MTGLRALVILGVLAFAAPLAAAQVEVGQRAPELDIAKDVKGKRVTLKALRGKPVVLNFCAAWAKPVCKKSLPAHDELASRFKGKVVVLVVMVDNKEANAKDYVRSLKLANLRFAFLRMDSSDVFEEYVPEDVPIPVTYLIDGKGLVRFRKPGYRDGDIPELEAEIGKLR